MVVKPTVLTTVPTLKIVVVDNMGTSKVEMAIHDPSGQRMGVVVEVVVPIVTVENCVEVVVMVVKIGFVATAVDAARASVAALSMRPIQRAIVRKRDLVSFSQPLVYVIPA